MAAKNKSGAREAYNLEDANEVGFFGKEVDPTPDENYSLLTPPDAPTPETDPELAAAAGSSKFSSVEGEDSQAQPKAAAAKGGESK